MRFFGGMRKMAPGMTSCTAREKKDMKTLTGSFALVGILGLGMLSSTAEAGGRIRPGPLYPTRPNYGNYYVAPGLTIKQLAYNTAAMGRAYSQYPAYMFGYNPYPPAVNYGPVYNPYVAYPGMNGVYSGFYNPYLGASVYNNPYNPYGMYGYSYLFQ
jgi:hypothetical protein